MKSTSGCTLFFLVTSILGIKTALGASHGCPNELSTCKKYCASKRYISGQCDGKDCVCLKNPDTSPTTKPATDQISKTETSHGCPDNVITCSKYCRTQGYNFATCYDNQCSCSGNPGENTTTQNDSSDTKVLQNSFGCPDDRLQCTLNCIVLKYITGTCYRNQCVCKKAKENSIPATIRNDDNLLATDAHGCPGDPSSCENYCNQQKYAFGNCSKDQCICHSNSITEQPTVPDNNVGMQKTLNTNQVNEGSHGCPNVFACSKYCMTSGYSYAECQLDQCKCGRKSSKIAEAFTQTPDTLTMKGSLGCPQHPFACTLQCIVLNFSSGNCKEDQCTCQKDRSETSSSKPEIVRETLTTENPYGCPDTATSCVEYCITNGYTTGECTGKHCTCTKTSMRSMIKPRMLSRTLSIQRSNGCPDDVESCQGYCSKLGHTSARCDDDQCSCLSTSVKVMDEETGNYTVDTPDPETYETKAPKSISNCRENLIQCVDYCINEGYISAKCRNNECKCLSNVTRAFSIPNIIMQALTTKSPDTIPYCQEYCKDFGFIFVDVIDGKCSCAKTVVNNNTSSKTWTQTMTTDNPNGCPDEVDKCKKYCVEYDYTSAECKGNECICMNPSSKKY